MPKNKITIGTGKEKEEKKQPLEKERLYLPQDIPEIKPDETIEEPLDENVWGNDYILNRLLDKEYLEERRLFTRVRYIQYVECKTMKHLEDDMPMNLRIPLRLTMIDLSMGGLGAIGEEELQPGSILGFEMKLDQFIYPVICQVIYCVKVDDKYRIGLKVVGKDKKFIKHLKIVVARLSLQAKYGKDK